MTGERSPRSWRRVALDLVLAVVATGAMLALYHPQLDQPSLGGGDNNEWREEARDRPGLAEVFDYRFFSGRAGPSAYFNPIQMLIWKVMTENFDYDREPRPYFVLGLIIHALNVIMVFLLGRELLGRSLAAFAAATCFSVFFPHYHTAGWPAAIITTGVSGFFLFSAIYFFVLYYRPGRRKLWLVLSCLAYLLGLFTKEFTVFAIPILAAYYVLTQRERTLRPRWGDLVLLPYCVLTVPMAYIVLVRLGNSAIVNEWGGFNFGIHLVYRFFELVSYLVTAQPAVSVVKVVAVSTVLALLPVLVWAARREPVRAFLAVWLAIALFVYSFSNFRHLSTLQRYMYQPSVPWFLLVFSLLPRKWPVLHYVLLSTVLCGAVGYFVYLTLESR